MAWSLLALPIGFILDLILGDPRNLPHPVIWIGKLIDFANRFFRGIFPKTVAGERLAGFCIWIKVVAVTAFVSATLIILSYKTNLILGIAVESLMCWQIMATKSLRSESMKVYEVLEHGSLEEARYQVSMIVGRDTQSLDDRDITKATVETVAENTSDGVIAPMIYMALGGAVAGFIYKAVNTMDSMLGYVEEPYKNVGFLPAKMDDFFNYIPARMAAFIMLFAGVFLRMDVRNGYRIFKRDRYNHASPNSAQTESVCAGLLGVELAGDAWYHGVLHRKKFIGEPLRPIEHEDIKRACSLMYAAAGISLVLCNLIHCGIFMAIKFLLHI